jgi:hypothetical protein
MNKKWSEDCADDRERHSQLIKEIKGLSEKQEEISKNLEECLMFYLIKIAPEERELLAVIIERATSYCKLYKSPKMNLSKEEWIILERLILGEINSLIPRIGLEGLPAELKVMYKQLNRIDEPAEYSHPNKNSYDSGGAGGPSQGDTPHEERKTKRQMQSEEEQGEEKKVKKKSINKLYKRLVKALHPDLDRDEDAKIWKENAMKRIAQAYEDRDLYALLEIENEYIDHLPEEAEIEDSEEFMAYNAILEGKVEALRGRLNHLVQDPRYGSLRRFFRNENIGTCTMMLEYERLKETVGGVRCFVESLQGPNGEDVFKAVVKSIAS